MPDTQITFDNWKTLIGRTNAYLLGLGEPIEQDDRGYNKADFHTCLNAGIEPEGDLLVDVADRLIKYHRQIGTDTVDSVKAGLDFYGDRLDRGRAGVSAVAVDGRAIVFFKYHANFVAAIKRLPQKDRRFDRDYSGWIVSPKCLSQAADLLEAAGANAASVRTLAEQLGSRRDGQADEAVGASEFAIEIWEDGGELVIKHDFDQSMNSVYRAAKVYFDRNTKTRRISREFHGKPVMFRAKAKAVLDALRTKPGEVKINGVGLLEAWAKAVDDEKAELDLQPIESVLRDGASLFPFQTDGVAFIENTGYMCIIGDEMGLGKTVQLIIASARTGLRTLVVCPASLKYNWLREIEKFTNLSGYVATTDSDSGPIWGISNAMQGGPSGDWRSRDFVIVNGDILIDRTLSEHVVDVTLTRAPKTPATAIRVCRTKGRATSGEIRKLICPLCKAALDAPRSITCPTCGNGSRTQATLVIRNSVNVGDRVRVEFVGDTVTGTVSRCVKQKKIAKSIWSDVLKTAGFGILAIDESHYYKNWKAKRTKRLAEIAAHIKRRIELTGTIIKSRPVELYSQLRLIAPEIAGQFVDFATEFCGGYRDRFGFHADGATNLADLHRRIKPVYLRRLKADVLPELPPKLHSEIPVEMDPALAERYRRAADDFIEYLKEEGDDKAATSAARAEHLTRITALKQLVLKPKIEAAIEFIRNANEQGEKVVAFSGYNEVIDAITAEFNGVCVRITGADSAVDRDAAVQTFQNDPAVTVFAGNITAAGVGLTLTASSQVLFTDEPWTPGDKQQAEDRCHRIGQDDCVNVYTLLAVGTIDMLIRILLEEKADVVAAVQDGMADSIKTSDILGDIVDRMRVS